MAPAILNYIWGGQAAPVTKQKNTAVRAIPSNWYNSPEMYELEKRAIFSKKWQLITHKSRFPNVGDYVKFNIVGFEIVISKDKKGEIKGFHNVCRHRAFPVVREKSGNAKIFACRYHGWSYGLDGKLAKAPRYDELEDFDKSRNGMFQVHIHVDVNGFVWINLDGKEKPEIAWEDDFENIDQQDRLKVFNFDDFYMDHEYTLEGQYNWKNGAENFNECYHCPTAHPDIPDLADIETHDVSSDKISIIHKSTLTEKQKQDGTGIASTYFFPNVSTSVLPHYIMLQRFLPTGPSSTTVHYQIFRNKHSTQAQFDLIDKLYAKIVSEDKELCELAQKNYNAGIFINGEMHPRLEKGPLFFQKVVRETIWDHVQQERAAKREIWPARQQLPTDAGVSQEDMDMCTGLACQTTDQSVLAW